MQTRWQKSRSRVQKLVSRASGRGKKECSKGCRALTSSRAADVGITVARAAGCSGVGATTGASGQSLRTPQTGRLQPSALSVDGSSVIAICEQVASRGPLLSLFWLSVGDVEHGFFRSSYNQGIRIVRLVVQRSCELFR